MDKIESNEKKSKWAKEEDKLLMDIVEINKHKNWKNITQFFPGKTQLNPYIDINKLNLI